MAEIQIGGTSYLLRRLSQSDDLEEYKSLYLRCDNVLVKGIHEQDERLQRIGTNHVKQVFQTDLCSFEAVSNVFFTGSGNFWVLVDLVKNTIVGSIALKDLRENNEGELLRMCVSPEHRRKGLGNYLVQHLLAFASSHNFQRVILTTPSSNTSAIQMYTKAGFVLTESKSVECGEDGCIEISKFVRELC
jgi:ribosomal protein S18 acetylase RimI-like enzyme